VPSPVQNDSPSTSAPLPDFLTVAAIGLTVAVCGAIIHEAIGHGGACLLSGGRPLAVSSVMFECAGEGRFVQAGGTIANLLAGIIFWLAMRCAKRSTLWRYFFWLSMTINFYVAGGYFLFSGVANIGDWAAFIQGLSPSWLWHAGLTILGVLSYSFFMWISLREMQPLLGRDRAERLRRARRLTLVPYFADGILSCVAGLFNPVGMVLVAISAAAASFGGASGLAWMDEWLKGPLIPISEFQMPPFQRSRAWIVAAGVLAVAFIVIFGPGLKFQPR